MKAILFQPTNSKMMQNVSLIALGVNYILLHRLYWNVAQHYTTAPPPDVFIQRTPPRKKALESPMRRIEGIRGLILILVN